MSEKGKRQQMNYDQKVLSEYEGKENGYTEEKFLNQENIKEEQHPMEKMISGADENGKSQKIAETKPEDTGYEQEKLENQDRKNEQIKEMGQVTLDRNPRKHHVELLTIIGEVEGHESAPSQSKTTKYEHVLPKLALVEDDEDVDGLLILLNTVGGDVEAGLAIAEMIASLSIPTVSLVLGGGHSIGVPMAVSADYSFVVPSATMVIHPVRSSGMFIGVAQTYRNMEKIQDRITGFIASHSHISQKRLEELMLDTTQLVKDVGTMLEGREAVEEGLIDDRITEDMVSRYLREFKQYDIDSLILGCTHYPLLINPIQRFVGDKVTLVNPAYEVAKTLKQMLAQRDMAASEDHTAKYEYYVSDMADQFLSFADKVLPCRVDQVQPVDIENY